tara:strand:- start:929 stop:1429 length:501 start_codon:yes stop_codon:yes gene_type:complete
MALSKITNASIGEAISVSNMPTGSVIQTVMNTYSGTGSANASSYTETATLGTITTSVANSKILIISSLGIQTQDANNIYSVVLRSSLDSYSANLVNHTTVNYDTNDHLFPFTGMTYLHSASQSASTAITYKYYVKGTNTTTTGWYCTDGWGQSGFGYNIQFLEIAP